MKSNIVEIVKDVKRGDSLWRCACGDVFTYFHSAPPYIAVFACFRPVFAIRNDHHHHRGLIWVNFHLYIFWDLALFAGFCHFWDFFAFLGFQRGFWECYWVIRHVEGLSWLYGWSMIGFRKVWEGFWGGSKMAKNGKKCKTPKNVQVRIRGVRYIDKPYRLSIYRHVLKISISISISIRSLLKISISIKTFIEISISISIRTFLKISISISIRSF